MGASLALAGMAGCTVSRRSRSSLTSRQPEEHRPGQAAVLRDGDDARWTRDRPARREPQGGRPRSRATRCTPPASARPTSSRRPRCSDLYDPDRSQTVTHTGEIRPWSAFLGAMRTVTNAQQAAKGAGLRILTETVCSPTLAAQIDDTARALPRGRLASVGAGERTERALPALRLAFGSDVSTHYHLEHAAVIVCARRRLF